MNDFNYNQLDPGVQDVVKRLHEAGFITSDSGDGVTKLATMPCALPFTHVVCAVERENLITEADRAAKVLGEGWFVEATYSTADEFCMLLCRTDYTEEEITESLG